MNLTDEQIKKIANKFLGYEKYGKNAWEIPKEKPWHAQERVSIAGFQDYLLSPEGFKAIFDKLTKDECLSISLNGTVSGDCNACIEDYCLAHCLAYGTGPDNATALIVVLLQYLEAKK